MQRRPGPGAGPPALRRSASRGRHGGVQSCAGPVPGGGHPFRRGRLHQSEPRSPRLPRDDGGVLRGEELAVHARTTPCAVSSTPTIPGANACSGRAQIPMVAVHRQRRQRHRAAARADLVHLARPSGLHAVDRRHQCGQRAAGRGGGADARSRAAGGRRRVAQVSPAPGRLQVISAPSAAARRPTAESAAVHRPRRLRPHAGGARSGPPRGARAGRADGGRVLVVFGCGGNRDRAKRPKMGTRRVAPERRGRPHLGQPPGRRPARHHRRGAGRRGGRRESPGDPLHRRTRSARWPSRRALEEARRR